MRLILSFFIFFFTLNLPFFFFFFNDTATTEIYTLSLHDALPISGEVFWSISNGVSKPFFAGLLALFAREAGAGRERIIVLGLDSAGWHTEPNLAVPDGIRPVDLPPYSPELQPAEHLWPVLDEPLANQSFETLADLERAVAERCLVLDGDQLSLGTNFHWWPKPAIPA